MWVFFLKDFLHLLHSVAWPGAFLAFSAIGVRKILRDFSTLKISSRTSTATAPSADENSLYPPDWPDAPSRMRLRVKAREGYRG